MSAATDPGGRSEIQALLALYGYLLDERDWPGLGRVFDEDAVFDASALGLGVLEGLDALRTGLARMRHPVAHHVTNVLVAENGPDGTATAVSKWLAPLRDGSVRSGDYRDELVRTPHGWRIRRRVVTLRVPQPDSL